MNDIFENAIDSLKLGLQFYIDDNFETAHKHAILTIYHSIELLLKEKLFRIHPILIYKNIDKPINDNANTVGIKDILLRYSNLKISLSRKEQEILLTLQKRRNRIEHHKYQKDKSDFLIIGQSLKFIYYFLANHLESSLEKQINEELYAKTREIILSFEERLEEAEKEVKERTTLVTKGDLDEPVYSAFCPECNTETIVIGTEKGSYCFLCRKNFDMERCEECGEYFSPYEINEFEMCRDCFHYKMGKW